MVCQPHQYILVKMASYVPQGYNVQPLYNSQQQKSFRYTAPRVADYVALSGYNCQKGYVGIEQSNFLQSYNAKRTTNYGESGYLFSKMPEVIGGARGDFFKTRRLNDLVGEDMEISGFTLPQTERKNPIQRSYEAGMMYKPQRREKQEKIEEKVDTSAIDRDEKDKEVEMKKLAGLIEQELKQLETVNQQVHYV